MKSRFQPVECDLKWSPGAKHISTCYSKLSESVQNLHVQTLKSRTRGYREPRVGQYLPR